MLGNNKRRRGTSRNIGRAGERWGEKERGAQGKASVILTFLPFDSAAEVFLACVSLYRTKFAPEVGIFEFKSDMEDGSLLHEIKCSNSFITKFYLLSVLSFGDFLC